MDKDKLKVQIEALSLDELIGGNWWFFYEDLESDNSYAVRYDSENTYTLLDIDETVNEQIIATNKDEIIKQVLYYFDKNNIQLCDIFQEE